MGHTNRSAWDIGREHYNQRDLYTSNARIDDGGYLEGPSVHPDIGSYAVRRDDDLPPSSTRVLTPADIQTLRAFYEHEAWPWLYYEERERVEDPSPPV